MKECEYKKYTYNYINAVTRKIIIKEGILESVEIIYDVIARGAEK